MEVIDKSVTDTDYNPYCPICDACGEEGCCSALQCSQHPDGKYCRGYMNDLRFGYKMYDELMKIAYDSHKEEIDKVFDIIWDTYYNTNKTK